MNLPAQSDLSGTNLGKAVLFWGAKAEPIHQEASGHYGDSPLALNKIVLNYLGLCSAISRHFTWVFPLT